MSDGLNRTNEVLAAYGTYRVQGQIEYYERQARKFEQALRRTMRFSAILLVAAALCGALGAVDPSRRGMWAFLAAGFAALSTAVATYEVAFGFERLSRQYNETVAALRLVEAEGPRSADQRGAADYVARVERLLRTEVDRWSHLEPEPPQRGDDNTTAGRPSRQSRTATNRE
jgi:hypothetical protein